MTVSRNQRCAGSASDRGATSPRRRFEAFATLPVACPEEAAKDQGLLLEELDIEYELMAVDVQKGEQHSPEYLAVNPNGKTPALVDGDAVIFDSNAILLYLANKTGRFLSSEAQPGHPQMLSWLMFLATGVGPFSGQAFHFKHVAPEPKEYALNRYDFEAWRHWNIIEARLKDRQFMMGSDYTIVDMAVWGWARVIPYLFGENVWEKLPNVKRLLDSINARPAAR
jgi:GST-like protein